MEKIKTYHLTLTGEYRVCSELNKRNIFATIAYGQRKGTDVYAIGENRKTLRIEVKTSQYGRFVTRISQKGPDYLSDGTDFWVLFHIKPLANGGFEERFFILSHAEICATQKVCNDRYAGNYEQKHGKLPDFTKGVDNVTIEDVHDAENRWDKIVEALREHQNSALSGLGCSEPRKVG